mgnify:CR=1 FL=1
MAQHNLSIDQHRTWSFSAIVKEAGVVQNITGYTFTLTIKDDIKAKRALLTKSLTVSGSAGYMYVTLSPTETAALLVGDHVYDIKMVKPSTEVKTLLTGKCVVNRVIGQ